MCFSAARQLIMQCFGFVSTEVSTESLLIDQPAVRSDSDMHQPVRVQPSQASEGGGMGMVSPSTRQPMETAAAAAPLPEPTPSVAAAVPSYNSSPLLQPTAVKHGPQ